MQKSLVQHLQPGTLELGKKIVNFKQSKTGVIAYLEDGRIVEGDALIAADGIHSTIRKKCLPNIKPRYSGYTCWRAAIHVPTKEFISGEFTETWGSKGRFGIVPLTNQQIYWFACVNAPYQSEKMKKATTEDLYSFFQNYHSPIPEIIKWTRDGNLIWNDIIDLKPIHQFAFNRVLLIGDAAHATTPNIGQGAGQAIEDAIILSQVLNNNRSLEVAFDQFERLRLSKTKKITKLSWQIGKAAQLDHRFLMSIRNSIMRILPSRIQERQLESVFKTDF